MRGLERNVSCPWPPPGRSWRDSSALPRNLDSPRLGGLPLVDKRRRDRIRVALVTVMNRWHAMRMRFVGPKCLLPRVLLTLVVVVLASCNRPESTTSDAQGDERSRFSTPWWIQSPPASCIENTTH